MRTETFRATYFLKTLSLQLKNGDYVGLDNICVYNENGIIAEVGYGYFESDEKFSFEGETILKRKEDFSKKINYVIKVKKDSGFCGYDNYKLYVHESNVDFQYLGLIKKYDMVFKKYSINGIVFDVVEKNLEEKELSLKIELKHKIADFEKSSFPMEDKELNSFLAEFVKLNRLIKEEREFINNYVPCEKDFQ